MGIIEGVINSVYKTEDIERLSNERLEICKACSEYANGVCSVCKCILSFKSRSINSKCPNGLWQN